MFNQAKSAIATPLHANAVPRGTSPRSRGGTAAVLAGALICLTPSQVTADLNADRSPPDRYRIDAVNSNGEVELVHVLERLQDAPRLIQLSGVNLYFNGFGYHSDLELWKQSDHWATPEEFLARGAGDCEDFAIAKYFALRALGVPDDHMFIAYVYDLSINASHMILVYRRPGAPDLVLDNRTSLILSLSEHKDLVPVYGFNATGAFLLSASATSRSRTQRPISYLHPRWAEILNKVPGGL